MTSPPARVRKAVIPAAGLGTRVLPATKAIPKEMLPLADKPTIQYVIEEAVNSGVDTHRVFAVRFNLNWSRYRNQQQFKDVAHRVLERQ